MPQNRTMAQRALAERPLCIAILAMGGQGGGVLADWIVALGEAQGWVAQSTSVPGVAQRTGATIYYIEMLPAKDGIPPVLALMPTPGDVDLVLAAEWMEAGRAMLRGLVTPDRTTVIASSHRSYAVTEKEKPGEGLGNPVVVAEAGGISAKKILTFDFQALAEKNGSMISAALFGALASAGVLPFPREAFEAVIQSGEKGTAASLRAFSAAFDRVQTTLSDPIQPEGTKRLPDLPQSAGHPALDRLLERLRQEFSQEVHAIAYAGMARVLDYQDAAYAGEYLDRLAGLHAQDREHGGAMHAYAFTSTAAKYLATAMAYDDVIRVADLKTRGSRFARVRSEVGVKGTQILYTIEYMHPRMEEVAGMLPARLGRFITTRPRLFNALDRLVNRGRRVKTGTVFWFTTLYVIAGMKRLRRRSLRHAGEGAHIARWLEVATALLPQNYDLAVEALACRRLVKGYSDTHARGLSKFDRVLAAAPGLAMRADGAAWLRRLKQSALLDEKGEALEGALKTVESLAS